jgi:bacteriocin-like protein
MSDVKKFFENETMLNEIVSLANRNEYTFSLNDLKKALSSEEEISDNDLKNVSGGRANLGGFR